MYNNQTPYYITHPAKYNDQQSPLNPQFIPQTPSQSAH